MSMQSGPDPAAIRQRMQQTWASGDYAMIGGAAVIVAENLVEAVDLHPGSRVLDVACGSGNCSIAAARRFCEVVGVDFVPELLERGKARAATERLSIEFREGDAEALPFDDASFDAVLSSYGAMFAPDQEKTAAELARVCRSGGSIGMANWTPEGFVGQLFRLSASYAPPPPGMDSPVLWGTEERLGELFGDSVSSIHVNRRFLTTRYLSTDHWIGYFRKYFGPMMKTFEALDESRQEQFKRDLHDLVSKFNRSGDETMIVPAEYLEVIAIRA